MSKQIQMKQVQMPFKDQPCPRIYADAPTAIWCTDGMVHVQYRAISVTDPATGAGVFSPVAELVLPLSAFFLSHDAGSDQIKQLEAQGIKRVPIAAITPSAPGGAAH